MFFNTILTKLQKLLYPFYEKSYVLQNLDFLIFINIILLIVFSAFAPSDNIGYFAMFIILLSAIKLIFKPREKFMLSIGDKFLLGYFLLVLISLSGSTLFALSLKGFIKTLTYIGFYISFIHFLKDNRDKLKYIFITIALVALAESFVALKQNFLSVSEISGWQDMSRLNPEQVMTRVYGSLKPYNPNLFGGFMLAILPSSLLLVFLPLINHHKKTAAWGLLCFCFILSVVILTGCRGAYLGLLAELIVLALITYRYLKPVYKKIYLLIISMLASILCFVTMSVASIRARIFSIFAMRSDSSNSFRFNVYNSCLDMFKDNWILGIGVGNQNFREIYGLYMRTGFDALSAYNIYLETAVESGVFALVAFLGFLISNVILAIRYILCRNNIVSVYLGIALISLIGMLIHGFVDTVFFRPQIQFIFWIMIGTIRVLTAPRSSYV